MFFCVPPLHNFKNTPLSRFFPSPAADTDQNNLFPTNQPATNSSTNSIGTISTVTSSERLRDPILFPHKKSPLRIVRTHEIPQFIFIPQKLVFRPYLLPSTQSFSLPAANKKNPRINLRTSTDQTNSILNFFKPSKIPRVPRPSSSESK